MHAVLNFISPTTLAQYALPANLKEGQEIANKKHVEIVVNEPSHVKAIIKGFPQRTTDLAVTQQVFSWGCTCTKKPDLFCKHLVATVIELARQEFKVG